MVSCSSLPLCNKGLQLGPACSLLPPPVQQERNGGDEGIGGPGQGTPPPGISHEGGTMVWWHHSSVSSSMALASGGLLVGPAFFPVWVAGQTLPQRRKAICDGDSKAPAQGLAPASGRALHWSSPEGVTRDRSCPRVLTHQKPPSLAQDAGLSLDTQVTVIMTAGLRELTVTAHNTTRTLEIHAPEGPCSWPHLPGPSACRPELLPA